MKKLVIFLSLSILLSSFAYADVGRKSVGRKELKKNAVTGKKVKDGSLSAADIKEATHVPQTTLSNGQTQELFNDGIVTLRAECDINDGDGNDVARVLVFSTEDGTAFDGNDITENLLSTTPNDEREIVRDGAATTSPTIDHEPDGIIHTPSDHTYLVDLLAAVNLFNSAGSCFFGGLIYHTEPEAT